MNDVVFDWLEDEGHQPESSDQPLLALVLTPTRELAIQVNNHIKAAAKYTDIKVILPVFTRRQLSTNVVYRAFCNYLYCMFYFSRLW